MIEGTNYQVPMRWYRVVWLFLLVCNLWFAGAYMLVTYLLPDSNFLRALSLNLNTFILATISLIYLVGGYLLMLKKNASLASFIGAILTVFVAYIALLSPLNTAITIPMIAYAVLWGVLIWILGLYGSTISIGIALVGVMSELVSHNFLINNMPPIFWPFLAITVAAITVNFIFWRARIESSRDKELDRLSGMLQSNRQQSEILIHS